MDVWAAVAMEVVGEEGEEGAEEEGAGLEEGVVAAAAAAARAVAVMEREAVAMAAATAAAAAKRGVRGPRSP